MMRVLHYICVVLALSLCVQCQPLVKVSQGMLKGKELVTEDGKCYHSYQGIPYARAPVGKLRFKPPQEPESWFSIRDATKEGNICKGYDMLTSDRQIVGEEDCLYLNVYTPRAYKKEDVERIYPVMVWIHGGGFMTGSGNSDFYGPDWLVERDVILVTLNYRLGPFGFLSLDIEEAPGNSGLKDQVAALRWVQENIDGFGGNPENVTIFGTSAGAASVTYLVLSDLTKGLFQKAIAFSATAMNTFAHVDNPKEHAFKLCELLGSPQTSETEALEFLRNVPADELLEALGTPPWSTVVAEENHLISNVTFVPTLEKQFEGQEAFLTVPIIEKLRSGTFQQVPFITGYAEGEGYLAVKDAREDPEKYGLNNPDFTWYVPKELCLSGNNEKINEVAMKIKEFYCKDSNSTDLDMDTFVKLKSDVWFKKGIDATVKLMAQASSEPVYYYQLSFDEFGILKKIYADGEGEGACHSDEIGFIFKNKFMELPRENSTAVRETHERLLELIVNFAKTGNPTPEITELIPVEWKPVTKDELNYLSIDNELTLKTDPNHEAIAFWENLMKTDSQCENSETTNSINKSDL